MDLNEELAVWGPDRVVPAPLAEAEAYCRRLATGHYENFPVVTWWLPRHLRQPFSNVYAFCRWADDLGDETGSAERSLELLAWWRRETTAAFEGRAVHPVFVALQPTIRDFALTRQPFLDLISAFEQDQTVREYDTFDQLRDYCARSADPVGRIVLQLFGAASERNIAWSDSICTGLQLANFWQDVARDAEIGRTYLPREDRERFQVTDDMLAVRRSTPEFQRLLAFEVARAEDWLYDGGPLIAAVPWRLRIPLQLFLRGGLRILSRVREIDYRVWETRPQVTKGDMAWAAALSIFNPQGPRRTDRERSRSMSRTDIASD